MKIAEYIRTDECHDVLASLEHCSLSLRQARQSDRSWKWVILSLHSALQGAMVCHLSGTAQLGALTKKEAKKWLERHEKKEDHAPRYYVASATELFFRLSCPSSRIESGGEIIAVTSQQRKSFKRLHDLRNDFTHFSPNGWSIDKMSIKEVIDDILDIMCTIQADPWPFRHMPEENRQALSSKIGEIREIVFS